MEMSGRGALTLGHCDRELQRSLARLAGKGDGGSVDRLVDQAPSIGTLTA